MFTKKKKVFVDFKSIDDTNKENQEELVIEDNNNELDNASPLSIVESKNENKSEINQEDNYEFNINSNENKNNDSALENTIEEPKELTMNDTFHEESTDVNNEDNYSEELIDTTEKEILTQPKKDFKIIIKKSIISIFSSIKQKIEDK